jgi:hypothetical protein
MAKGDLTALLSPESFDQGKITAEHLSYIEDGVSVPCMERAVRQNGPYNSILIGGLERVGDLDAVEALGRILGSQDALASSQARFALEEMLRTEREPNVKDAIRQALHN